MNKPTLSKVKFKSYEQHQSQPFPSSLDDWIPENDLGRLVSLVIDKMELDSVLNNYPGGGVPSYHPKMRLKVDYLTSQQKYEQKISINMNIEDIFGSERLLSVLIFEN